MNTYSLVPMGMVEFVFPKSNPQSKSAPISPMQFIGELSGVSRFVPKSITSPFAARTDVVSNSHIAALARPVEPRNSLLFSVTYIPFDSMLPLWSHPTGVVNCFVMALRSPEIPSGAE